MQLVLPLAYRVQIATDGYFGESTHPVADNGVVPWIIIPPIVVSCRFGGYGPIGDVSLLVRERQ